MSIFSTALQSVPYAVPVALAAIGETVCQSGGIINIGLEGTMLSGAFFGMYGAFVTHNPWLGVLAGIVAGVLCSLLFGWLTIYRKADQVVVGTAINLGCMGLTGTLFRSQFGQSGQLLSVPRLPSLIGVDPGLMFLLASVPLLWFGLRKTGWGLALRSAGEYPKSTEAAGFSVSNLRLSGTIIGGIYGALGGVALSLVIAGSFAENMTAGRGFVAIAIVTFGRWKPLWVFAAALFIGYAESLQFQFQTLGTRVPYQLFIALPYVLALLVLVIVGKGTRAPAALGQPHEGTNK